MCGIFGAIGDYHTEKLKVLALLNESRGKDSYGYYNGRLIFRAAEPIRASLGSKIFALKNKGKYLLGHTRFATMGSVKTANAHPFHYGNIVGAHNGCLSNLEELCETYGQAFEVDSQAIFWGLDRYGHGFLKEVEAYWGLWWVDLRTPDKVYLMRHENTLSIARDGNALYFSSNSKDLRSLGLARWDLKEDMIHTVHVPSLKMEKQKIHGLKSYMKSYDWRTSGYETVSWWTEKADLKADAQEREGEGLLKELRGLEDKIFAGTASQEDEERYWELATMEQNGSLEVGHEAN